MGALAGFGALVYGVGAAILWLRYATTGFNADEGLAVAPRGEIVFLGFRWTIGWAIVVATLAVAMTWLRNRIEGARLPRWVKPGIALALLFSLLLAFVVFSAVFLTWSALTLSVDLLATALFVCWDRLPFHTRQAPKTRTITPTAKWAQSNPAASIRGPRHSLRTSLLFVAILGAVSAIGWQLEVNLPYVAAQYRVVGQSARYDGIYFGESGGYFYIAPRPGAQGEFFRAIAVYPASNIYGLSIRPGTRTLCTRVNRPEVVIEHAVSQAWRAIEQHFRRTGQPDRPRKQPSSSGSQSPKTPPPGFCPSLP